MMMSDRRLGNRGFFFPLRSIEEQSFLLEAINGERGLCTLDEMYENSREEFFLDHAFVCLTGNNAIESMRDNSKEGGPFATMDYDPIDPRSPTSETRILFPQKKRKKERKSARWIGNELSSRTNSSTDRSNPLLV